MSTPERKLIGFFSADTDVDDLVDAIIASLPPDKRPVEDRPNRLPPPESEPQPEPEPKTD
jgi:hypothetical protein